MTSTPPPSSSVLLEDEDGEDLTLRELAQEMARCLPLATRSSGVLRMRKYHNTFVGKDAIDWMVSKQHATSRQDAIRKGNNMILNKLIRHARDPKQPLKDKKTSLYKFLLPSVTGDNTSPKSTFSRLSDRIRGRASPSAASVPSVVLASPASSVASGSTFASHAMGTGLTTTDRRAISRLTQELAENRAVLQRVQHRLEGLEAVAEGRTLFDLVAGFVFREGLGMDLGLADPDGSGQPPSVATVSFIDVCGVVLRTIALIAGMLLCGRCMETILRFLVGQETPATFLASCIIVVTAAAAVSFQFVRARTVVGSPSPGAPQLGPSMSSTSFGSATPVPGRDTPSQLSSLLGMPASERPPHPPSSHHHPVPHHALDHRQLGDGSSFLDTPDDVARAEGRRGSGGGSGSGSGTGGRSGVGFAPVMSPGEWSSAAPDVDRTPAPAVNGNPVSESKTADDLDDGQLTPVLQSNGLHQRRQI